MMETLERTTELPPRDVAVVGGGLAGLAAAALLARAGRSVVVFERAGRLGGRAITQRAGGYSFNLGPHALYRDGAGIDVLRELGIEPRGGVVAGQGTLALADGELHLLPADLPSLVRTRLLDPGDKLGALRLLAGLGRIDAEAVQGVSVAAWLERNNRRPAVRRWFESALRVATYADDPQRMSAGAALAQVRRAARSGVLYLDGGWQTLVDELRRVAEHAGAWIESGARVAAVEGDRAVRGVRLADGRLQPATAVILATGPAEASALVDSGSHPSLRAWAGRAIPVRAAVLDVGLRPLPRSHNLVVFGVDEPLYLSVHSAWAQLAPEGGAVVHVMKYLGSETDRDPKADERRLEALLDLVQPGWREALVMRRFLPSLLVANALPTADQGGTAGRPGPSVPGIEGLYVAGDWVGQDGLLSDAALASAQQAARLAAREAVLLRPNAGGQEGRGAPAVAAAARGVPTG